MTYVIFNLPAAVIKSSHIFLICLVFVIASCTNIGPSHSDEPTSLAGSTPKLIRQYPLPGATDAHTHAGILIQFDQTLDPKTVTKDNFRIAGVSSELIHDDDAVVLIPLQPLIANTQYTVSVPMFDNVSGISGNNTTHWSFKTGSITISPPPLELPTRKGKEVLLRFPYIQSPRPNEVSILWTTRHSGNGKVSYRSKPEGGFQHSKATQTYFNAKETGLSYDYYQYEARLSNLLSNTVYEYQVSHKNVSLAKGVHFKTLPATDSEYTHFIAFGDSGTKYSQPRAVRDRIIKRAKTGVYRYPHDFIAGLGDNAYFNGSYQDFEVRFFDQLSARGDQGNGEKSILATRPYFPTLGNHEYADNDKRRPSAFITNFSNPVADKIPQSDQERYFSFDVGRAHFITIDSMKFLGDYSPGQREMLDWLKRDLSATKQAWKIIFLHHAIFSNGPHGTYGDMPLNRRLRQQLAPILQKHNVQLVINGHDHLYQRSVPLKVTGNGLIQRNRDCSVKKSRDGVVYLVVGIGGIDLQTRELEPVPCSNSASYRNIIAEYGDGYDFVAERKGKPVIYDHREANLPGAPSGWGFLRVTVSPFLLTGVVYNIDGIVLDRFAIVSPLP